MWAMAEAGDVPQDKWRRCLCRACNLKWELALEAGAQKLRSSELILDDLRSFIFLAVRSGRHCHYGQSRDRSVFLRVQNIYLLGGLFMENNINTQVYVSHEALDEPL